MSDPVPQSREAYCRALETMIAGLEARIAAQLGDLATLEAAIWAMRHWVQRRAQGAV